MIKVNAEGQIQNNTSDPCSKNLDGTASNVKRTQSLKRQVKKMKETQSKSVQKFTIGKKIWNKSR